MARILSRGPNKADFVAVYKCDCGSLVEFARKDVKPEQRDGDYVVCPGCRSWIAASLLMWKPARARRSP